MLYSTAAGIDGRLIMKVPIFERCVLGMAAALICLTGIALPLNARAQTQPDSPPPDNSATTDELPPYIYTTSPLAQVVRLTQAGVDQSIILTYVTNSGSTFNLDSDKIIYLRDLGLPNEVINAMMQRDLFLQQQMPATPPPAQPAPTPPPETTDQPPAPPEGPPPTEVTVNNFYDTLTPYGAWVNIDGYGRCWRPSVVVYNSGWQPYCDHGHWVYTDCGWYWFSDYSWGWAPFHYGRWLQHPRWGWCWTPDTVWGPSWVTWRYSNGYCGWAPLPPFTTYRAGVGFFYRGTAVSVGFNWGLNQHCFTFVPTQFFCDPHPRRHSVPPAQVTQIFNQTTVINNFNGHDHRLANRGIDPEHITAVTRTPIRPITLRDAPSPAGHGPRGDQFSRDGRTLIVGHPTQPWSPTQNRPGNPTDNRTVPPTQPAHPTPYPGVNDHNPQNGNPVHIPPQQPTQPWSPVQNRPGNPTDNRTVPPSQPARPTQYPGVTDHNPQNGNPIHISPQQPTPPANFNNSPPMPAPTAPNQNNRTYSPRGGEQSRTPQPPRPNTYNPGTPVTPVPNPGQGAAPEANHNNASTAAPVQSQPQQNQSSSSTPRSSNQNQNQNGSGNNSGNGARR